MRRMAATIAIAMAVGVSACGTHDAKPPTSSAGISVLPLPADFPRADVPLIDGTLLSAHGSAADGWNLTVQGGARETAALDNAVAKLTAAGFHEVQRNKAGGNVVVVVTATKSGHDLTVEIGSVVGAAGGQNSVFYQVSTS